MISTLERSALVKSLADFVRRAVAAALLDIVRRLDEQDARIRAIPAGPQGERGPKGEIGHYGERGLPGIDGKEGKEGKDGRDGRDGQHGRDALELEILPAIDPKKSYPRATFAKYKGGIIRSVRHTDAIGERFDESGWEVLVDGVADVCVDHGADPREFWIACTTTSGLEAVKKVYLPVAIYQQVFKEGTTYRQGDMVTWGGSLWHCNQETQSKPGDANKHWTLAVKEGRRGKDGADGTPGERGPEGRPGRDLTQMGFDGSKH